MRNQSVVPCPVLTVASWPAYRLLKEAGQVVWYSHLFQNFPQFIMIHTVKGFGIVNKAEVDVFLELSCFFHDPADVGNLISGSLTTYQLTLEVCNHRELWHTCSLIWQEIFYFSSSTRFIWLFSFFFHIHSSLTILIQVLIMPIVVNKLNFEMAIYEETKPSTKASKCTIFITKKKLRCKDSLQKLLVWGEVIEQWVKTKNTQNIYTIMLKTWEKLLFLLGLRIVT